MVSIDQGESISARDVSLFIWCNKMRAQSLDKRRVLTSMNACRNKISLHRVCTFEIDAHKKKTKTKKIDFHLASFSLICLLLLAYLLSLYWSSALSRALVVSAYNCQFICSFRVHPLYNFQRPQHRINVGFFFLCVHLMMVIWDDTTSLHYASK